MLVEVKNLSGTGSEHYNNPHGYSSWKEFWIAKSGMTWPNKCSASCCHQMPVVGAHVKKVNSFDSSWYIVPLCQRCNMRSYSFYVDDDLLVPLSDED